MACAGSPRKSSRGFSMIEVAIAIAVIAILAGAAAPLVLKAINQQREKQTRDDMKVAWEALFGATDRRVSNMRADQGFSPGALADLRAMTTRPAGLLNWGPNGQQYSWGWAGPYWTGPIRLLAGTGGIPLDRWGRPLILNYPGANSWQIQSYGPDGVANNGDDLRFPAAATPVTRFNGSITINFNQIKIAPGAVPTPTGNYTVTRPRAAATAITSPITSFASSSFQVLFNTQPLYAGPQTLVVNMTTPGAVPASQTFVFDLLPGEQKVQTITYSVP